MRFDASAILSDGIGARLAVIAILSSQRSSAKRAVQRVDAKSTRTISRLIRLLRSVWRVRTLRSAPLSFASYSSSGAFCCSCTCIRSDQGTALLHIGFISGGSVGPSSSVNRRFASRAADQRFLALIDPANGSGFKIEWSGTDAYAVIVDDVNPHDAHAIIWRLNLQQLHGSPAAVVCRDGKSRSERKPMHKTAITLATSLD